MGSSSRWAVPLAAVLCLASLASAVNLISSHDPALQYIGRHIFNNDSTVSFDWSGVQVVIGFAGTTFGVVLHDPGNNWHVFIDGNNHTLVTAANQSIYMITSQLPSADHTATLVRASEAQMGISTLVGFLVSTGTGALPLPPRPNRRIEWVGDSITCGYGILGTPPCNFTLTEEDNWLTYGPVTSRALNADYMVTCQSGIGLVRNYGSPNTTSPDPLPSFWNRTLETVADESWLAQVVVINLGTNDYSTQPTPPDAMWIAAYHNFIEEITAKYTTRGNSPTFFVVCGPMISGEVCANIATAAKQNNATYINLQNILSDSDLGCNGHPNVQGHALMSSLVLPVIKQQMGW